MIKKYRKKLVVIEAEQFIPQNETIKDIKLVGVWYSVYRDAKGVFVIIPTLKGEHRANALDWIIKGVQGEFYPYKPDIFEATYEEVL